MASCLRSGGTFSVSLSSCCSSVKAQKARQNARILSSPGVRKNGARISCGLEERYRRYGWGAQGRADRVQSGCGARVLKPTLFPGFRNGKGVVVCGINGKSLEAQDLVQAGDAVVIVDHGSRRPESNVMLRKVFLTLKPLYPSLVETTHGLWLSLYFSILEIDPLRCLLLSSAYLCLCRQHIMLRVSYVS